MNNKSKQTLEIMFHFQIIPLEGGFEINKEMINFYTDTYRELTHNLEPKINAEKLDIHDIRYNRKLAAINLLKLNLQRGHKPKAGIVYAISNPAYKGYYKVGITQDLDKRLASYQTYDPLRRFKVDYYRFVENKVSEEKRILSQYKTDLALGEWIVHNKVHEIFPETL